MVFRSLLLLVCFLGSTQCGVIFRYGDSMVNFSEIGNFTRYINSDDPFGEGVGDVETLAHIQQSIGTKCNQKVPCRDPIAMEVDFSDGHKKAFPNADLAEALECLVIADEAKNPLKGFYCSNHDQRKNTPSSTCLDSCEKNGMKNVYQKPLDEKNCSRCPDFQVRYFCLYDSIKVCQETGGNGKGKWNSGNKLLRQLIEALKEN